MRTRGTFGLTGASDRRRRGVGVHASDGSHLGPDGVYSFLVLVHLGLGALLALGWGITLGGRGAIATATVLPLALPSLGFRLRFLVQLGEGSLEEVTKHRLRRRLRDLLGRLGGFRLLLRHRVPTSTKKVPFFLPWGGDDVYLTPARIRGVDAPIVPASGLRASSTPYTRPCALVRVETRVSRSDETRSKSQPKRDAELSREKAEGSK